jgi:cytidine deaminase
MKLDLRNSFLSKITRIFYGNCKFGKTSFMTVKEISIPYEEFDHPGELPENDTVLIKLAEDAAMKAYAPYSGFMVGCAVRLKSGIHIVGNNQENAAYPSGLCAERTALFYASAEHPADIIETLAITAMRDGQFLHIPVFPCGSCRQVMVEYESRQHKPIRIILAGQSRIMVVNSARELLPFAFDSHILREGK